MTSAKLIHLIAIFFIAALIGIFAVDEWKLPLMILSISLGLWITEIIPLPFTALLIPTLAVTSGVLTPSEAASAFGNEILFLFIGVFFIVHCAIRYGLAERAAQFILSLPFSGRSPAHLIIALSSGTFFISMWISNTATAALMLPIFLGICSSLPSTIPPAERTRFETRGLIGIAFAASIGGMATPIGTPPNAIAVAFLAQHGIAVGFLDWIIVCLPFAVLLLAVLIIMLSVGTSRSTKWSLTLEKKTLPAFSYEEKVILVSIGIAALLWFWPSFPTSLRAIIPLHSIPIGFSAIIATIPLFLFTQKNSSEAILTWKEASTIDWGTILLFGGGLCLGTIIEKSEIAQSLIHMTHIEHITLYILVLIGAGIILSEISSNTAAAAVLIPLLFPLAPEPLKQSYPFLIALACSFGFMLPISTPPNALIFGTGKVPLGTLMRFGLLLDVLGAGLLLGYFLLIT